jgi:NTP pyrophosphatase (non-canonical NTP hydrolase)
MSQFAADLEEHVLKYQNPFVEMDGGKEMVLLNALLGLCGESGEDSEVYKKHVFQGHKLDKDKLVRELGDVLFYLGLAAYSLNIDIHTMFLANQEKLSARYGEGFMASKSVNRSETSE